MGKKQKQKLNKSVWHPGLFCATSVDVCIWKAFSWPTTSHYRKSKTNTVYGFKTSDGNITQIITKTVASQNVSKSKRLQFKTSYGLKVPILVQTSPPKVKTSTSLIIYILLLYIIPHFYNSFLFIFISLLFVLVWLPLSLPYIT